MISGLVVHLSPDERLAETAIEAIRADAAIQIGERFGCRLPLVLESQGSADAQARTDELLRIPGVVHIDVTIVHFEDSGVCTGEVENEQR